MKIIVSVNIYNALTVTGFVRTKGVFVEYNMQIQDKNLTVYFYGHENLNEDLIFREDLLQKITIIHNYTDQIVRIDNEFKKLKNVKEKT